MKALKVLGCGGLFVLGVYLTISLMGGDQSNEERTGYFRDGSKNRVLAYYSTEPLTEDQARELLDRAPYTPPRLLRVVAYSGSNPALGQILTDAGSIQRALQLTVEPPFDDWDWLMMINPRGDKTIQRN